MEYIYIYIQYERVVCDWLKCVLHISKESVVFYEAMNLKHWWASSLHSFSCQCCPRVMTWPMSAWCRRYWRQSRHLICWNDVACSIIFRYSHHALQFTTTTLIWNRLLMSPGHVVWQMSNVDYTHTNTYIYIYVCVFVCVYILHI